MTPQTVMKKIESIIDTAKTAILSTVDSGGKPRNRWMSPLVIVEEPEVIYAVTAPTSRKIRDITSHPAVSWMIQSKDLREIIHVQGKINIIDNPALRARVMEKLIGRLNTFWRLQGNTTDFVVLETVIDEAEYFKPIPGVREKVVFGKV